MTAASGSAAGVRTALPRLRLPLSGEWELQPGSGDHVPECFSHSCPVPGLVDLACPGYDWNAAEYHWYRKRFAVPEVRPLAFLLLEQSMYGTAVELNGIPLGSDIACYTSQEYAVDPELLRSDENSLMVRVGPRHLLPPESAVGKDQEQTTFPPGIWGDVSLVFCGNPRVRHVQVIPRLGAGSAEANVTLENRSSSPCRVRVTCSAFSDRTGESCSGESVRDAIIGPNAAGAVSLNVPLSPLHRWSPSSPFLYRLDVRVERDEIVTDLLQTRFGMREFSIRNGDFLLNGEKIFLRGGNIAFHRFLSDPDHGRLPWDPAWIKRVLVDIPRAHNFNFFRNHLGQMYNRWYDIADEWGIMIQNEWQFWTTSGTREQITREFTRWVEDNCNHPSIVIWDALNESTDPVVQQDIVPAMKQIDPTRSWECVDFVEEHPYIYSLGPVLNSRRFGFTDALRDIETSALPSVVNEFLWWWLDPNDMPTSLTRQVLARWLGPSYTNEDVIRRQSFLARELVELFRRMGVDAIQPFVYLSNGNGPTGNWFSGPPGQCRVKPVLAALANAFSPFGVSAELWDRHFFPGERRSVRFFVFNDDPEPRDGLLRVGIRDRDGHWVSGHQMEVSAGKTETVIVSLEIGFPVTPGEYRVRAELSPADDPGRSAWSEKEAFVIDPPHPGSGTRPRPVALLAETPEIAQFLKRQGIAAVPFGGGQIGGNVAVVGEGMINGTLYRNLIPGLSSAVREGSTLILQEPEYGVSRKTEIEALEGLVLEIEPRNDTDRGGYDSYVFPDDSSHPVWAGILPQHLRMMNGGFGGEAVSEHNVRPSLSCQILARCGLDLAVPALFLIRYGKGCVLISRIQTRGRLVSDAEKRADLYARREDPVLQRLFLNYIEISG